MQILKKSIWSEACPMPLIETFIVKALNIISGK